MEKTGYWIVYCNPIYFDIKEFLLSGETFTTWSIMNWQKDYFEPGQWGVIRVGVDNRSLKQRKGGDKLESGVYAIFEVISYADYFLDPDFDLWLVSEKRDEKRLKIKMKISKNLILNPILLESLKNYEEVKYDMPLIKGQQASSWSLKKSSFKKIIELCDIHI